MGDDDQRLPRSGEGEAQRQHPRTPLSTPLRLYHPSFGSVIVKTRDISPGGLFLVIEQMELPPVGSVLEGQVEDGFDGERPVVKMQVVRMEPNGIGLKFIDD